MSKHRTVRKKRIFALLRDSGFVPGIPTRTRNSITVVRRSDIDGLYESVIVDHQGRYGEAVYANVGTSVTRAVMYKQLGDVRHLLMLDDNKDRNWTIFGNDWQARKWEDRLAEIAPREAQLWATEIGPALLQNTRELRTVVDKYVARIGAAPDLDELIFELARGMTETEIAEADRLYEFPGIRAAQELNSACRAACHLLMKYSREIEQGRSFFRGNPLLETDLQDRIIVLTDRLYNYANRALEHDISAG